MEFISRIEVVILFVFVVVVKEGRKNLWVMFGFVREEGSRVEVICWVRELWLRVGDRLIGM